MSWLQIPLSLRLGHCWVMQAWNSFIATCLGHTQYWDCRFRPLCPALQNESFLYRYEDKQYTELRFVIFFFQQTAENLASTGTSSLLSLLFLGEHIAFLFLLACTNYATQLFFLWHFHTCILCTLNILNTRACTHTQRHGEKGSL